MLKWLKGIGWIVTLGAILTAVLFALAGARSLKKNASARRKEDHAIDLMNTGITKEIDRGKKLMESASKDKTAAIEAKAKMKVRLQKLGDANEDIDDIAARHNARRMRHQS